MNRYFIICKDEGRYVFATRRYFAEREAAEKYMRGINPAREPILIEEDRPLVLCTAGDFEVHGEYKGLSL